MMQLLDVKSMETQRNVKYWRTYVSFRCIMKGQLFALYSKTSLQHSHRSKQIAFIMIMAGK